MKELFDLATIRTEQPTVIPGKYLGKLSENGTQDFRKGPNEL